MPTGGKSYSKPPPGNPYARKAAAAKVDPAAQKVAGARMAAQAKRVADARAKKPR